MEKRNWVICPQRLREPRSRLFCFAPAGVGMAAYRGWDGLLGGDVEVLFIQLPGRDGRPGQQRFTRMRELVPELSENITEFLDLPYSFYGHSLGALISFETARELRRQGEKEPVHLMVGAARAPQLPNPHALIHHLKEQEFLTEIHQRYGGIPPEVMADAELRALLTPVLRADVTLVETYQYVWDDRLDCSVTAFGGVHDRMVTHASLEAWREQTTGEFRVIMLDDGHFFVQSRRVELLRHISQMIHGRSAALLRGMECAGERF